MILFKIREVQVHTKVGLDLEDVELKFVLKQDTVQKA